MFRSFLFIGLFSSAQLFGQMKDSRRGDKLFEEGRKKEALVYYKKAINANQEHIPSYHNLGLVYEEKNDITNALFTYAKVLKMDPDYVLTKERVAVLKNKR